MSKWNGSSFVKNFWIFAQFLICSNFVRPLKFILFKLFENKVFFLVWDGPLIKKTLKTYADFDGLWAHRHLGNHRKGALKMFLKKSRKIKFLGLPSGANGFGLRFLANFASSKLLANCASNRNSGFFRDWLFRKS